VVKEVVWKKLDFTGAVTTPTHHLGLWRTCRRTCQLLRNEWSLGGITEDTYVTLTYTNPDGTTDSVITTEP
jgi:hypothetical protein